MTKKIDRNRQRRNENFAARTAEIDIFSSLLPLNSESDTEILVVYGIGGIGKSELLNQFMRIAAEQNVAVARIDPQVHGSVYGFIIALYEQLQEKVPFPRLQDGFKRHQEIETKLVGKGEIPKTALRLFAKSVHVALKLVPGVNVVAEVVEPGQIEAAMSAIYGAIGRKDGDFWMKPEEELTERLVADLGAYSAENRLVILVDTYEIIGDFDSWVRDSLFANLEDYAILVIAGRRRLEGRQWQEYAPGMRQIELRPLTDAEARRYLRDKRNVQNPQVVDAMVDYADGHPLTLAMLADLADQIEIDDLTRTPERRHVLRSVIDRVTQNVATNMRTALEACAILRVVNQDNLAYLLDAPHVDTVFDELQRFEFVKLRDDGIALHDAVRAAMNEEMRWQSPARYRQLNEKAAEYYESLLSKGGQGPVEQWKLERLYHRACINEEAGIWIFQEMAEESTQYRLASRLQILLSDTDTYPVANDNFRLWRKYYQGRLAFLETRLHDALTTYQEVAEDHKAESRLRAYAYCDWGWILCRREVLRKKGGEEEALRVLNASLSTGAPIDSKLATSWLYLSDVFVAKASWKEAQKYLDEVIKYSTQHRDFFRLLEAYEHACGIYSRQGNWPKVYESYAMLRKIFVDIGCPSYLISRVVTPWEWILTGRLSEYEQSIRTALTYVRSSQEDLDWMVGKARDLAMCLALQDRPNEAEMAVDEASDLASRWKQIGRLQTFETSGIAGLVWSRIGDTTKGRRILLEAVAAGIELKAHLHLVPVFLAATCEITGDFTKADESYALAYSEACKIDRNYVKASALVGLFRSKHKQRDYAVMPAIVFDKRKGYQLIIEKGTTLANPSK